VHKTGSSPKDETHEGLKSALKQLGEYNLQNHFLLLQLHIRAVLKAEKLLADVDMCTQ